MQVTSAVPQLDACAPLRIECFSNGHGRVDARSWSWLCSDCRHEAAAARVGSSARHAALESLEDAVYARRIVLVALCVRAK